jgi:hypothetical protein
MTTTLLTESEFEAAIQEVEATFNAAFTRAKEATYANNWPLNWQALEAAIIEPAQQERKAARAALEARFYGDDYPTFPVT